jgi:type I restriction enzyme S subunit
MKDKEAYSLQEHMILITRSGTLGRIVLITKYLKNWIGSDDFIYLTITPPTAAGYIAIFLLTTYGRTQLLRETYGGVISHLEVKHVAHILFPDAPLDIKNEVGRIAIEAYEKKDQANLIENEAIKLLENKLKELAG